MIEMVERRISNAKVTGVVTTDVTTVRKDLSIRDLRQMFERHDFNAFPVVEKDRLVGIVTKMDLLRIFSMGRGFSRSACFKLLSEKFEDIMREATISIRPDDSIRSAIEYMVEFRLRNLPVVEGGKLVGIVSRNDVIRCLEVGGGTRVHSLSDIGRGGHANRGG